MARYRFQSTFVDGLGRVVSGGQVTVYKAGTTTLATIYSTETGISIPGSILTTNPTGFFSFWVDDDDYYKFQKFDIVLSKTGFNTQTHTSVSIFTQDYTYYADPGEPDHGVASGKSIKALIDEAGPDVRTIVLNPGNYTVVTALTIPANITIKPQPGSLLIKSGSGSITFNGKLKAGITQVFSGFEYITFKTGAIKTLYPEWFGAVADDATDCTDALQCSINSAARSGLNIELGSGVYVFSRLYFHYHVTENPNWPNDTAIQGRVIVRGTGMMAKNNYTSSVKKTYLKSTDSTGPAIFCTYNSVKNVYGIRLENLSIEAENTTQVVSFSAVSNVSGLENVFLVQKGTGDGLLWNGMWLSDLKNVVTLKSTLNRTGQGIIVKNTTTGSNVDGQCNTLSLLMSQGFQDGIVLGSEDYDTSKLLGVFQLLNANVVDCTNGILIGRVENVFISNCQIGGDYTEVGMKLGNHAKNIRIVNNRVVAKDKALAIGYGTAADPENAAAAQNICIENNYIMALADNYTAIKINNASVSSVHSIFIANNRIFGGGYVGTTGISIGAKSAAIKITSNNYNSLAMNVDNSYYAAIKEGNSGFDHFYFNDKLWSVAAAIPSVGTRTWAVGDVIINNASSNSKPKAWMCTTGGNPGTWTALSANGGTTGNRPALGAGDVGFVYYNTTTNKLNIWNGSAWVLHDGSAA